MCRYAEVSFCCLQSHYDKRIWPRPPDVDVENEAQRLAAEAIQNAATVHRTEGYRDCLKKVLFLTSYLVTCKLPF